MKNRPLELRELRDFLVLSKEFLRMAVLNKKEASAISAVIVGMQSAQLVSTKKGNDLFV